ncbi:MAG: DUF2894 domain-containing protein [Halioglobus sp.]
MNEAQIQGPFDTLHTARLELARLQEIGAHRFDPVRFRYIDSMTLEALEHREPVARILAKKSNEALDQYRTDFEQLAEEARHLVAQLTTDRPAAADKARELLDNCQFRELARWAKQLGHYDIVVALASLSSQLEHRETGLDEGPDGGSFEDFLRQQESAMVSSLASPDSAQGALFADQDLPALPGDFGELKSVRQHRESRAKISADKLVTRAIAECPEEAGPLNPQKLVIRSLSAMRDLSPHYLNRFVTYIDTLLWLEQADAKTPAAKTKF